VARGREEKGGSAWARPRGGGRRRREGDPDVAVGSSGRPATAPNCRARVVPWPHEQRRVAGVGDASDGVSATDGQDRGEAGPGGSGRGAREKRESETGRWWGTDMQAQAAQ
jgi:hypothetical protein